MLYTLEFISSRRLSTDPRTSPNCCFKLCTSPSRSSTNLVVCSEKTEKGERERGGKERRIEGRDMKREEGRGKGRGRKGLGQGRRERGEGGKDWRGRFVI